MERHRRLTVKRHRRLLVSGAPDAIRQLLAGLRARSAGGWQRSMPRERSIDATGDVTCFECDTQPGRQAAVVWVSLRDEGRVLYETTVLPTAGVLDVAQSNAVLESFVAEMVEPLLQGTGLHLEFTPAIFDLSEHLSAATEQLLWAFASLADRDAVAAHPGSEARWQTFLIAAHREKADLPATLLSEWLADEGWPPDVASRLGLEYTVGRRLLGAYDATTSQGGPRVA